MPETLNPFRREKPELDPDQGEFLRKFGGADDEGLKAAGVTVDDERRMMNDETTNDKPPLEGLDEHATPEEREAFLDAIVEFKGTRIMRRDLLSLESIFYQLNKDLKNSGSDGLVLGEGLWGLGTTGTYRRIEINKDGRLAILRLRQTPITTLDGINLPEKLSCLDLGYTQISSINNVSFPDGLSTLSLDGTPITSLDNVNLPNSIQTLELRCTQIASLDKVKFPSGNTDKRIIILLRETPLIRDRVALEKLRDKCPNCRTTS